MFGTERQHIGHPLALLPEKVSLHATASDGAGAEPRYRLAAAERSYGALGRARRFGIAMPNMVSVPFKTRYPSGAGEFRLLVPQPPRTPGVEGRDAAVYELEIT